MSDAAINKILEERRKASAEPAESAGKFYSILGGEGLAGNFLEFQFRNGLRTCFNYNDLQWYSWDPDSGYLDLEFGGIMVTIKGRGLYEELFQAIKHRKAAWVKEADAPDMQDHEGNAAFVEEITILPPKEFGGDGKGE
jgi:hypothetical protein